METKKQEHTVGHFESFQRTSAAVFVITPTAMDCAEFFLETGPNYMKCDIATQTSEPHEIRPIELKCEIAQTSAPHETRPNDVKCELARQTSASHEIRPIELKCELPTQTSDPHETRPNDMKCEIARQTSAPHETRPSEIASASSRAADISDHQSIPVVENTYLRMRQIPWGATVTDFKTSLEEKRILVSSVKWYPRRGAANVHFDEEWKVERAVRILRRRPMRLYVDGRPYTITVSRVPCPDPSRVY